MIKNSLLYLCLTSFLIGCQVYADWGSIKITNSSEGPMIVPSQMSQPQKQGSLNQRSQLVSKKKQYQSLIDQVNKNMILRPDLIIPLKVQLNNYLKSLESLNSQIIMIDLKLNGSAKHHTLARRINADNSSVQALASRFGLRSKALVHFPELILARNNTDKKLIIKKKLDKSGYRSLKRNDSTLIDDKLIFKNGSAELLPNSNQRISNLAALYHRYGAEITRVVIKVHTNAIGDTSHNLMLSRARSNKIKSELMKLQVPASVVVSQGFGESVLLPNISPESNLNNRVEFDLVKTGGMLPKTSIDSKDDQSEPTTKAE